MRNSSRQRWSAILGLIAMFGVIFAVPAITMAAVAKAMPANTSSQTTSSQTVTHAVSHDGMACEKPCNSCPAPCGDLANCMLKCFQTPGPLPISGLFERLDISTLVQPVPATVHSDTSIPPLLRPPSA